MTTEIHIRAEIHNDEKVVHVKIGDQEPVVLLPGEATRAHVYEGQSITITEEDASAPSEQKAADEESE